MVTATGLPLPVKTSNGLEGVLFQVTAGSVTAPDSVLVEKRFAHNSAVRERELMALRGKLDAEGIYFTNIEEPVAGKGPEPVDLGVQISGDSISRFIKRGGILYTQDALKNVTFQTNPAQDRIVATPGPDAEDTGSLRMFLNGHGIKFTEGEETGSVVITDPRSICAVVLSGGRFNGSSEYLEQHSGLFL